MHLSFRDVFVTLQGMEQVFQKSGVTRLGDIGVVLMSGLVR